MIKDALAILGILSGIIYTVLVIREWYQDRKIAINYARMLDIEPARWETTKSLKKRLIKRLRYSRDIRRF